MDVKCTKDNDCNSGFICINQLCKKEEKLPLAAWIGIGIGAAIVLAVLIALIVRCLRRRNKSSTARKVRKAERMQSIAPVVERNGPAPLPAGYKKPVDLFQVAEVNKKELEKRQSRYSVGQYDLSQIGFDDTSSVYNSEFGDYPQQHTNMGMQQGMPSSSMNNRYSMMAYPQEAGMRPAALNNNRFSYQYPVNFPNQGPTGMGMQVPSQQMGIIHPNMSTRPISGLANQGYFYRPNGQQPQAYDVNNYHRQGRPVTYYEGNMNYQYSNMESNNVRYSNDGPVTNVAAIRANAHSPENLGSIVEQPTTEIMTQDVRQFVMAPAKTESGTTLTNDSPLQSQRKDLALNLDNVRPGSETPSIPFIMPTSPPPKQTDGRFSPKSQEASPNGSVAGSQESPKMKMVGKNQNLSLEVKRISLQMNSAAPASPSKSTPLINFGNSESSVKNSSSQPQESVSEVKTDTSTSIVNKIGQEPIIETSPQKKLVPKQDLFLDINKAPAVPKNYAAPASPSKSTPLINIATALRSPLNEVANVEGDLSPPEHKMEHNMEYSIEESIDKQLPPVVESPKKDLPPVVESPKKDLPPVVESPLNETSEHISPTNPPLLPPRKGEVNIQEIKAVPPVNDSNDDDIALSDYMLKIQNSLSIDHVSQEIRESETTNESPLDSMETLKSDDKSSPTKQILNETTTMAEPDLRKPRLAGGRPLPSHMKFS